MISSVNYNENLDQLFEVFLEDHHIAFSYNLNELKRKLGISRIAKINGLANLNMPVFIAIRPNAKYISVSSGKGLETGEALISTLMETAESDALEFHYRYDLIGSYNELSSDYSLLSPQKIHAGFLDISNIFDAPIHWIKGVNLVDEQEIWVPCESVFFEKKSLISDYFTLTSNGVAASFSESYAINHALYELIERHCLTQWQNHLSTQAIDNVLIDTSALPSKVSQLIQYLNKQGLDIFLWDIANPHSDISCFQAASLMKSEFFTNSLFTGSVAHVDAETAIIKAILETVQCRAGYISGSRDDIMPEYYQRSFAEINQYNVTQLYGLPKQVCQTKNSLVLTESETTIFLLEQLKKLNISEAIMVKLSDDPVPVVKIIIPQFLYNFRRM